jgi:hypothetical protein
MWNKLIGLANNVKKQVSPETVNNSTLLKTMTARTMLANKHISTWRLGVYDCNHSIRKRSLYTNRYISNITQNYIMC